MMARRFAARHRARDDMSCCPPRSGGHQLNGADTAPCGRGGASLAPFVGQNDDPKPKRITTRKNIFKRNDKKCREEAVIIFPKSGVQLISRPLEH